MDETRPNIPPDWTPLDEQGLAHLKRLRLILRFLASDDRIAASRDRITVFGSAVAGKQRPGDIDVLVDHSDHDGSFHHPDAIRGLSILLTLGRQFYGSFDPFVMVGKILYCRDEDSMSWIEAKRARSMVKAARENGRPPSEVLAEIAGRPYEMGGRPAPRPEPEEPAGPRP